MKTKSRLKYVLALPLFVIASFGLQLILSNATFAADLRWTGGGDGVHFSDGANWSTGSAPVNGDRIIFSGLAGTNAVSLQNDLTGVSFSGVVRSYTTSSTYISTYYTIDKLSMAPGAQFTQEGFGQNVGTAMWGEIDTINDLTAMGDMSVYAGIGNAKFNVAGNLTATLHGSYNPLPGSTVSGTIIIDGTQFGMSNPGNMSTSGYRLQGYSPAMIFSSTYTGTFSLPITVAATGEPSIRYNSKYSTDPSTGKVTYFDKEIAIASPITLNSDLFFEPNRQVTLNVTGSLTKNGYAVAKRISAPGMLEIAGVPMVPPVTTKEYNDSQPGTNLLVGENDIAILNGVRDQVGLYRGGMLKGHGRATALYQQYGSIVAPGNSPGTLTFTDSYYNESGEYQAEIITKDSYDRLVIGESHTSNGNAVTLNEDARLTVLLIDDWSVKQGDQFMIIDNRSSTAIEGTFYNLPEGAEIMIDGVNFKISYVGGDGNDVVLTALNTVTHATAAPNTAARVVTANPALVAVLGILTASLMIGIGLRVRANKIK